ncbi:Fas apoptotic inhibitory molecule 1 [Amphibalanus amphitrite]|uniref:Fas apoptotic inhibitory molecule 1 n=2 Tax=Amphibalanus amphitrite TaxID=1232801 RepID=A0A6A4X2N7_AMPAM|nr:fas apoptotic inhibitory molecule 1-like [Amphibalanus amphitrite]XP_043202916.1 fas apoptotic inhibitory molecule 1-like [Amphibalanus amphitrite]XP_043202917.1 fas apoptotic inhibitory molecule 1-like [Amphibalanus amphitrite]XP_043227336.1 fas apoptotic inhibitory molecule 1-like isoform X2 [Amphibalanus amphitrite]XP_043227337.1 fas apoptotic inhibitory molecule 1-like isoform X2 [Amphibalanus amphitrite]KAF0292757.1 Fas apoptotic inhibitory molecule 1 [Amphibalanus amphitrite]KAF03117
MAVDLVAVWDVPCSDGIHQVEVEHGTISGRRIIKVDGQEIVRRDWMFRLVGSETFEVGRPRVRCTVKIEPCGAFAYQYSLDVDGKAFRSFTEHQSKVMRTWLVTAREGTYRVVLEKGTLDVWVNGRKLETAGEFVEDGTETHFEVGKKPAYIRAVTSGDKRQGLVYSLYVQEQLIPEHKETL